MAKDPAFLFYSQDFYVGTATLSFEDRGKYITLLCLMHQQGRMPEETIRLLVGSPSVNLKSKFSIDENGLWFNDRLEVEAEKRAKFTESRRSNGSLGGRPKANGYPIGLATKNLAENENIISNKSVSKEKKDRTTIKEKSTKVEKTSTETPPDAIEVIEHLNTLTGRKFNPQRQQTAKFVISRLNDGYTSEDLKKIIECKVRKWGDDEKMRQYLRPETLFAPSKVDAYLQDANDTQITKPSQNGRIRDKF